MTDDDQNEMWVVADLLGRKRHAGRLIEVDFGGGKLFRIDIPEEGGGFSTRFFGAAAVYEIAVVTEAVARQVAARSNTPPVSAWEFPRDMSTALADRRVRDDDEENDLDDDAREGPGW